MKELNLHNNKSYLNVNLSKGDNFLLTENSNNVDSDVNIGFHSMSQFFPRRINNLIDNNNNSLNNNYKVIHIKEKKNISKNKK